MKVWRRGGIGSWLIEKLACMVEISIRRYHSINLNRNTILKYIKGIKSNPVRELRAQRILHHNNSISRNQSKRFLNHNMFIRKNQNQIISIISIHHIIIILLHNSLERLSSTKLRKSIITMSQKNTNKATKLLKSKNSIHNTKKTNRGRPEKRLMPLN